VRPRLSLLLAPALVVSLGVPVALASHGRPEKPAVYLVGGGEESINPTGEMLANSDFYLGGFGFGSGHPGNVTALPSVSGGRYATGILGDGVHSRALAVSDGKRTIVLAQIETQGYFDAYKEGPFGENEIRKDAAAELAALAAAHPADGKSNSKGKGKGRGNGHGHGDETAPAPTAAEILVDSDHSHGGPDTAGVWGGVPTSYLKRVHDRTVQAIVEAWTSLRPATLTYGIAHAGVNGENYPPQECIDAGQPGCVGVPNADWILNNQYSNDPSNQAMDDEIRVLQARDPDTGAVLDTYVNYGAHPDVLGSSNRLVTGDYPGRVDLMLGQTYGGFGFDQVSTLGREQPDRKGCFSAYAAEGDSLCALDSYASEVMRKVGEALALAHPLTGEPIVAMNSYLLTDATTSAVLAAASYGGSVIGAPIGRAANPPWYTGPLLGTSLFVGRIGSVLVTGGPGEMYAQIWQKVRDTVTADKSSGITSVMNIGTAGDFLGYIIAPLEAYPEPIRRSVLSGDPPPSGDTCSGVPSPVGCPDPIGNDNYFFNISHTFGERLTCDFLRGAGDILDRGTAYWSSYVRCPAFANDLALSPGADTQFPEQPDLSAVMTHM
jgi:hypothetical protein